MAQTRFQLSYTPASKLIAAAKANGWTEDSGDSLLDACGDHFTFEEAHSEYDSLDDAVRNGQQLIERGLDFFGQVSVEEQEYLHVVDDYYEWETVADHQVDETGLIETVRRECDA